MFFLVLWVNAMHAVVDAQREQHSVAFAVEKDLNAAAAGMHVFFCGTAHVSSAAAAQAHNSRVRCKEACILPDCPTVARMHERQCRNAVPQQQRRALRVLPTHSRATATWYRY